MIQQVKSFLGIPPSHMGVLFGVCATLHGIPDFQLEPGLASPVLVIWRMNQQMEDISQFLCHFAFK